MFFSKNICNITNKEHVVSNLPGHFGVNGSLLMLYVCFKLFRRNEEEKCALNNNSTRP